MARPRYCPPSLNRRIKIRALSEKPVVQRDEFGNDTEIADWGDLVWASVRDSNPLVDYGEQQLEQTKRTVFTIRKRDVQPDSEVVHNNNLYALRGDPIRRGGSLTGMNQEYMELHCEWVSGIAIST